MKSTNLVLALALALPLAATGCDKSESGGESAGKAAGGDLQELPLPKLGLKTMAPAGSEASDALIGDGVMIMGPDLVVTIEQASPSRPATLEAAKEEAELYSPKQLKSESLSDGWAMTFQNTGSIGTNYFVQVRREIAGVAYACETTAHTAAQQANALAACKHLTK